MSKNRSLLTMLTEQLNKKPSKPKAPKQQLMDESNPFYIAKSDIAGKGAFASQYIPKGSMVDMLHRINQPGQDYDFTELGRNYNHSDAPNTKNKLVGNKRFMVATQDIMPGQELTGNYRMQPDLEQPQDNWKMRMGGGLLSKKITCNGCGHSWKATDGGSDPLTCHNCGAYVKMQQGGQQDEAMRSALMQGLDKGLAAGLKGAKWIGKNVFGTDDIVPDVVKDYVFNTIRPVSYPTDMRQVVAEFTRSDKAKPTRDMKGDLSMDEEAWSRVLRRPTQSKYFVPSKYKPSNATDPSAEYYTLSPDVFDGERMKRIIDDSYFNRNKRVNKAGQEYVPMQTVEPFMRKQFMKDYKKYAQMPFDQTDPLANFQIYRGVDPKTKKKYLSISDTYDFGMESANEVIKPMNIYDRFYYATGGQSRDEREMVNGIADILVQVRDPQNRAQIGAQMMQDFEREDVTYDPEDFREMAQFKYGGHGGLDRWFAEKWVDVKTGKACGRQEGESRKGYPACRPSKRVNSDTPKTSGELSAAEKAKFKREKTSSKRIDYNHKKEEGGQVGWLDKYDIGGDRTQNSWLENYN